MVPSPWCSLLPMAGRLAPGWCGPLALPLPLPPALSSFSGPACIQLAASVCLSCWFSASLPVFLAWVMQVQV